MRDQITWNSGVIERETTRCRSYGAGRDLLGVSIKMALLTELILTGLYLLLGCLRFLL
jgi:hypothetical protein